MAQLMDMKDFTNFEVAIPEERKVPLKWARNTCTSNPWERKSSTDFFKKDSQNALFRIIFKIRYGFKTVRGHAPAVQPQWIIFDAISEPEGEILPGPSYSTV